METRHGYRRSVQPVGHVFRPSETLVENLHEFTNSKPGASAPRFLLASTFQVALNTEDYLDYMYAEQIHRLEKSFFENAGSIVLNSVAYRAEKQGLTLRFTPESQAELLHAVEDLDTLPNIIEKSARNTPQYLKLTIPARQLKDAAALGVAWSRLREGIAESRQGIYSAKPEGIVGSPAKELFVPLISISDAIDSAPVEKPSTKRAS